MGSAGSGRPGVHSHRYSTDLRSAYPIAQAIEFIEHTYCTARPFMSSAHVLGIGELLGKILDEGQVPGGLVTDAVIVAACTASMASTQCCPTTATSTAFRIPGSRGSASDRPMYHNCDCSLGVQILVAVNSSPAAPPGPRSAVVRPEPRRRWILKIPVARPSSSLRMSIEVVSMQPRTVRRRAGAMRTRKMRCPEPRGAKLGYPTPANANPKTANLHRVDRRRAGMTRYPNL